jgi:hypothetical protein
MRLLHVLVVPVGRPAEDSSACDDYMLMSAKEAAELEEAQQSQQKPLHMA